MKLSAGWKQCEACGLLWREGVTTHVSTKCEETIYHRREIEAEFERMQQHAEHHMERKGQNL